MKYIVYCALAIVGILILPFIMVKLPITEYQKEEISTTTAEIVVFKTPLESFREADTALLEQREALVAEIELLQSEVDEIDKTRGTY